MAEDNEENEDRTEEASPERREEFREKGQIAVSKEISSVFVLAGTVGFLSYYTPIFMSSLLNMFTNHLSRISHLHISGENIYSFVIEIGKETTLLILPIFAVTAIIATTVTLLQTRFNFSWKRLKPDFSRLNPLKGIVRMFSWQAPVELLKGIGKMSVVGVVSYLILYSEWSKVPGLMHVPMTRVWDYWGDITRSLFLTVAMLLIVVAGFDYLYNFISLEKKLKMTKKEVKEEHKKREVDPHIKNRIRRMQRDIASRRMVEKTEDATVLITNPTHYSIALKYQVGMDAPILLAKGVDFLALQMREVAKEKSIPIVENKPLARALYKMVDLDQTVPASLYKAVSEVIRYVFQLKGINFKKQSSALNV